MVINFPENLKKRNLLGRIIPFLDEKEIILLYGMRQTGKTSLLFLIAKHLLSKKKVPGSQVVYIDLENIIDYEKFESLKDFKKFISLLKEDYSVNTGRKVFVLIDEIQHLSNPSSLLKFVYDHFKEKVKFIVTGSSSLEIKKKFTDALTGRIFRFEVRPLNFQEYTKFSEEETTEATFEKFSIFGGFPAVSLKKNDIIKKKLLSEIYSLYVRRDIKDLGALEDVISFNKLVGVLASQIGGLVSEVNLANNVGVARPTIKNYLFILENTFVVDLITPHFTNPKKEITKTPKVYFMDNGVRNAVLDNFLPLEKRTDAGTLIEEGVYSELKNKAERKVYFWRTERKQEVDFVVKDKETLTPYEVKYQQFKCPFVPPNLKVFIQKYSPSKAYVLTKNFEKIITFQKTKIIFYPCWKISDIF